MAARPPAWPDTGSAPAQKTGRSREAVRWRPNQPVQCLLRFGPAAGFPPFETTKTTTVSISLDAAGGTWINKSPLSVLHGHGLRWRLPGDRRTGSHVLTFFGSVGHRRMPTTIPHKRGATFASRAAPSNGIDSPSYRLRTADRIRATVRLAYNHVATI